MSTLHSLSRGIQLHRPAIWMHGPATWGLQEEKNRQIEEDQELTYHQSSCEFAFFFPLWYPLYLGLRLLKTQNWTSVQSFRRNSLILAERVGKESRNGQWKERKYAVFLFYIFLCPSPQAIWGVSSSNKNSSSSGEPTDSQNSGQKEPSCVVRGAVVQEDVINPHCFSSPSSLCLAQRGRLHRNCMGRVGGGGSI